LNDFGFNKSFNELEQRDCCLLVGLNPRTEGSLINTRLRKGVLSGKTTVYTFGPQIDLTFNINHLGSHFSSFLQFIEGKHFHSKSFTCAKQPTIVFGDSFLEANSKNLFLSLEILKNQIVNLNYLHSRANHVTQSIIGLSEVVDDQKIELGFALEEESLNNPNVQN
jgi:NADH dehydrogenase/NADH:ubiquinone oxidoreductase subunit G